MGIYAQRRDNRNLVIAILREFGGLYLGHPRRFRAEVRSGRKCPEIENLRGDNLRARYGRTRLRTTRSRECESDHAREKQDYSCNSNSEEAF
jgi:hypothetical protein